MTLDLFTVTVMTAIVASVASITYILETIFRRDAGPGGGARGAARPGKPRRRGRARRRGACAPGRRRRTLVPELL